MREQLIAMITLNQTVVSNCDLFTYIPDAIMPDRTNLDPVVNEYGLKLISMCKSSGLRIQNGRWEKNT